MWYLGNSDVHDRQNLISHKNNIHHFVEHVSDLQQKNLHLVLNFASLNSHQTIGFSNDEWNQIRAMAWRDSSAWMREILVALTEFTMQPPSVLLHCQEIHHLCNRFCNSKTGFRSVKVAVHSSWWIFMGSVNLHCDVRLFFDGI